MDRENLDFLSHIHGRGIYDLKSSSYVVSDNFIYFWLFNLSGQLCGYQRYYWRGSKKTNKENEDPKYYTYITKEYRSVKNAVWGLETYIPNSILFIVEGIFDAIPIHKLGYPCIAVLGYNPANLKQWLNLLPVKTIAVLDGDKSGFALSKYTDDYISLPDGLDPGDFMSDGIEKLKELNKLLENKYYEVCRN